MIPKRDSNYSGDQPSNKQRSGGAVGRFLRGKGLATIETPNIRSNCAGRRTMHTKRGISRKEG